MKLESFKEKNTKRKAIIIGSVFVVLLISVIVFIRSFALFETKQEYNVIKGAVGNYNPSDITITSYIDGNPSKTFPAKESEYAVDKVECNNGARGLWNYTNWEVNLSNLTMTGTKCKVYFVKSYKETILNGTDPIISENLIPVSISNDGTVKKADMTSNWYSYEKKTWANAVILNDESKVYQNGEVIPENNIESYFVWIPRYKYKIFNEGKYSGPTNIENKVQQIEIVFENKNTAASNGSTVGSYLSHPAFTSFNSNGLWVGKFDTGYKGATTTAEAFQKENDSTKVIIKPNTYAWAEIQASKAHLTSYYYQRSLDSHMMKNTEWGAIAYLSHSKYGSIQSVRINNNTTNLTGYASVSEPTCGYTGINENCNISGTDESITKPYNTSIGHLASTTGNISGVYDMAGGPWKVVMGVIADQNGRPMSGGSIERNSGFSGQVTSGDWIDGISWPESKYYDLYNYSENALNYSNRILGDATGEMGPFVHRSGFYVSSWYQDRGRMVMNGIPWFMRSALAGEGNYAGIFAFHSDYGSAMGWVGFRIVLSTT